MSRINVEDRLWNDYRLKLLAKSMGSEFTAIGALLSFWRVAQDFWVKNELVPEDVFHGLGLPEGLLEAGFAERTERGIYACGAETQFSWLLNAKKSGKKGGIASGIKRRNKNNVLSVEAKRSGPSISAKHKASETNPPSPSPTPSLSLTTLKSEAAARPANDLVPSGNQTNPVSIWCREYTRVYGTSYEVMKREAGMITNFAKGRSLEKIQTLFACYLAIKEKLYVDQRHPLSLFFRDLPKIVSAAQSGVDPSKPTPTDYAKLLEAK